MSGAEKRVFTVAEANALLPELERRFTQVMQLRGMLRTAYLTLEKLGEPPDDDTLSRTTGSPELLSARARFRGLLEALTEQLHAIEDTGVAIKDVDSGLCDFLGERQGHHVWLCWRFGEKRITHWHELDAGFSARQPLAEEPPQAPGRLLH